MSGLVSGFADSGSGGLNPGFAFPAVWPFGGVGWGAFGSSGLKGFVVATCASLSWLGSRRTFYLIFSPPSGRDSAWNERVLGLKTAGMISDEKYQMFSRSQFATSDPTKSCVWKVLKVRSTHSVAFGS
jgi:hypothetical protein